MAQNRDLYVHSVGLQSQSGAGGRMLVEQGCKTIEGIADILNDWKMIDVGMGNILAEAMASPARVAAADSAAVDPAAAISRRLEAELNLHAEGTNR